jgi:AIG2 family protein
MALVFQFGSNASSTRLNSDDRLRGDAKDLGLVRTEAMFELDFDVWSDGNECAAADLRSGTGRVIWGVLYDVPDYLISRATSDTRKSLDAIEGPRYQRRAIAVQAQDGTMLENVVTYTVREPQQGLQTSLDYVSHILTGLREHGAADEYLAYVKDRAITNNPGLAADLKRLWPIAADANAYFDMRNLASSVGEPGGCSE